MDKSKLKIFKSLKVYFMIFELGPIDSGKQFTWSVQKPRENEFSLLTDQAYTAMVYN